MDSQYAAAILLGKTVLSDTVYDHYFPKGRFAYIGYQKFENKGLEFFVQQMDGRGIISGEVFFNSEHCAWARKLTRAIAPNLEGKTVFFKLRDLLRTDGSQAVYAYLAATFGDFSNNELENALIFAARYGESEIINGLKSVMPNINRNGASVVSLMLDSAVVNNQLHVVRMLIGEYPNVGEKFFIRRLLKNAAEENYAELTRELLRAFPGFFDKAIIMEHLEDNAKCGNLAVVRVLLEQASWLKLSQVDQLVKEAVVKFRYRQDEVISQELFVQDHPVKVELFRRKDLIELTRKIGHEILQKLFEVKPALFGNYLFDIFGENVRSLNSRPSMRVSGVNEHKLLDLFLRLKLRSYFSPFMDYYLREFIKKMVAVGRFDCLRPILSAMDEVTKKSFKGLVEFYALIAQKSNESLIELSDEEALELQQEFRRLNPKF